jgi:6-phosphofructokinase 1
MVDAHTTSRWYFVIAMGRKAGHLALGIGKAAGATLTLIGEEFHAPIEINTIVDTLAASIIKRYSQGRPDGVAVIAEGVVLSIPEADLAGLEDVERDPHGHLRIADVDLGEILRKRVRKRLAEFGIKTTIVAKNVGYELRCADPIPIDMEYTRDLGYCATEHLMAGGSGSVISIQSGRCVPIPFAQMVDPRTGRTRVRLVDVRSSRYGIAREYMTRLERPDLDDPVRLARLAAVVHLSPEAFRSAFQSVVACEARAPTAA